MSVNLVQNADGGMGRQGVDLGLGSELLGTINYNVPITGVAVQMFYTNRKFIIDAIVGTPVVAGSGGAATFSIYMTPSGTAPASGTVLHSGTYNMVGTANTAQSLTLTTTAIPAGYAVWAVPTGTATAAIGGISVVGRPA
jgi:hypothetical protein